MWMKCLFMGEAEVHSLLEAVQLCGRQALGVLTAMAPGGPACRHLHGLCWHEVHSLSVHSSRPWYPSFHLSSVSQVGMSSVPAAAWWCPVYQHILCLLLPRNTSDRSLILDPDVLSNRVSYC